MKRNLMEALEPRQLLSAAFSLAPNDYGSMTLTVQTGNKADNVTVTNMTEHNGDSQLVTLKVTMNGKDQMFTHASTSQADKIQTILVQTGAGNDHITVINKDYFRMGAPMLMVNAGKGNDSVLCEGGFCLVEGGSGNDYIVGRTNLKMMDGSFSFSFSGGDGNDVLIGCQFNDALNGGNGNDALIAGDGDDYIQFGQGQDLVFAGRGDDYMVKGFTDKSRSTIFGGEGNDTLAVFTGNQQLPLNHTFSRLRIMSVENYVIDKMG